MSVQLRRLREEEFDAWVDRHRAWYAIDLVENGGLSAEAAGAKAERDVHRLFPTGFSTPGNQLFLVEAVGETVGSVWFSPREEAGESVAFLYAIEIADGRRGQGLGREAMRLFEEEARRQGFRRAMLNVFGGNERARNLYRSIGYAETAVHMGKDL